MKCYVEVMTIPGLVHAWVIAVVHMSAGIPRDTGCYKGLQVGDPEDVESVTDTAFLQRYCICFEINRFCIGYSIYP